MNLNQGRATSIKGKYALNCDLGEGMGNEQELMPYLSYCNIACGGHAGDEETMVRVIQLAMEHKVQIGAHPSYPDVENFGRLSMSLTSNELVASIRNQIQLLEKITNQTNAALHHIKPHGALYNDLIKNEELAYVFLEAINEWKERVKLMVPHQSIIWKAARAIGFQLLSEAFGDRSYNQDLSLVSRVLPNAVLTEPSAVLGQLREMIETGKVTTIQGEKVNITAQTYCIHGDNPRVLEILHYLAHN